MKTLWFSKNSNDVKIQRNIIWIDFPEAENPRPKPFLVISKVSSRNWFDILLDWDNDTVAIFW